VQKYSLRAELAAEFLGTLILILLGNGVVAMVVLFAKGTPGEVVHGGFTNITIGWGLAVTMGCYAAGRISGAHLNPAVTIAFAISPGFLLAQGGALHPGAGGGRIPGFAALVFWNYLPAFHAADPHLDHTAGVFTTFPAFPDVPSAGLLDQTIGTAILLFMVMALTDARNQPPGANLTPVLVGAVVVAIGMSFGGMHGYAINPARDFGPRLFTVVAGFKNNGLTDGSMVFWVPIAGPILGGIVGAAAYDWGVRRFLPE
jgi:glycerol uptake facilitator protein